MPRLRAETVESRREEIARATVRAIRREGLPRTSIADIVHELGGSAGGIYAHFADKAELARFVATRVVDWRTEAVDDLLAVERAPSPMAIAEVLLDGIAADSPGEVVLQFWAEATVDAAMQAAIGSTVADLRQVLERALRPWVTAQLGGESARTVVQVAVDGVLAVCQGYITQCAVVGPTAVDDYLASLAFVHGLGLRRPEGDALPPAGGPAPPGHPTAPTPRRRPA